MLHEELNELKQFVADLKADRAATKEKEQREAWTKYTAISLVFIAVLLRLEVSISRAGSISFARFSTCSAAVITTMGLS